LNTSSQSGLRDRRLAAGRDWSARARLAAGIAFLVAYLIVVAVLSLAEGHRGWPALGDLASSPRELSLGHWWLLFTSGFVVDGPLAPQIVLALVVGVAALRVLGAALFWSAVAAGHVVGTVVVYVGVWVAGAIAPAAVQHVLADPDYGISLVWCTAMGVMAAVWFTGPVGRRHVRRLLAVAMLLALAGVTALSNGLAQYEHVVAFGIGALAAVLAARHGMTVSHNG
jgi:hypothetical protein